MENKEKTTEKTMMSVDEYIKMADEKLVEFIKSGRYKDVLLGMANLYRYSLRNQILMMIQKEDVSVVNGMTAWNYIGRSVIPGEKSIKIIQPIFNKYEEEVTDEEGMALAKQFGAIYQRTSAKDVNGGVDQLFKKYTNFLKDNKYIESKMASIIFRNMGSILSEYKAKAKAYGESTQKMIAEAIGVSKSTIIMKY